MLEFEGAQKTLQAFTVDDQQVDRSGIWSTDADGEHIGKVHPVGFGWTSTELPFLH
jgi:hypothetical protein